MFLVFDIGGTKTRVALTPDLRRIRSVRVFKTPAGFSGGLNLFRQIKKEHKAKFKGVCGGIAGSLDLKKRKLINSVNLPGWQGKPIRRELEKIFKTKIILENDADLGGLGEAVFGAGKGRSIVVYFTISSGVGGTRIVDERIDRGIFGFEPGKQLVSNGQTLEQLISGKSIKKKHKKSPSKIRNKRIWEESALWLARGLVNSTLHWSPEVIVLGGSMVLGNPGISIKRVLFHFRNIKKFPKDPLIRKAKLGDLSGLYGACVFLKNHGRENKK